jgi:hypothetical protein
MFSDIKSHNPTYVNRAFLYSAALALAFFLIGLWLIPHHEMWRDEIQPWLLARDSSSISELFANLKYEGHPGLWHLLLVPLTRYSDSPILMQYLHMVIATGSIYLLARYSPFSWPQKILLALSYYLFYEYSIISRNYAIGVFLLFAFCSLFPSRKKYPIAIALTLFLLSHTSVLGTILAIALSLSMVVERYVSQKDGGLFRDFKFNHYAALAVIVFGIVSAIIQLKPPVDSGFAPEWHFHADVLRLTSTLQTIGKAYFPIPEIGLHYWNSQNVFFNHYASIIAILAMFLFAKSLLNRPSAGLFFLLASFALLTFFYVKYIGYMRHHGFLFLVLIAALWIAPHSTRINYLGMSKNNKGPSNIIMEPLFILILSAQVIGGLIATYHEYKYVFSQSKNVAQFILDNKFDSLNIIGDVSYAVSPIAGYLNKSAFFYSDAHRYGTFVRWDKQRNKAVDDELLLNEASALTQKNHKDCLIILNRALKKDTFFGAKITHIYHSEDAVVGDEIFNVYRFELKDLSTSRP